MKEFWWYLRLTWVIPVDFFIIQFITAIESIRLKKYILFKHRIFYLLRWLFGKTRHFKFLADVGSSEEGLDHAKICFYRCQSFLFIVAIVISILLKTTFLINFKPKSISVENFLAIKQGWNHFCGDWKKYQYGPQKTVWKHLDKAKYKKYCLQSM